MLILYLITVFWKKKFDSKHCCRRSPIEWMEKKANEQFSFLLLLNKTHYEHEHCCIGEKKREKLIIIKLNWWLIYYCIIFCLSICNVVLIMYFIKSVSYFIFCTACSIQLFVCNIGWVICNMYNGKTLLSSGRFFRKGNSDIDKKKI